MPLVLPPLALRPTAVRIENATLWADPSPSPVRFVPRGVWLNLARMGGLLGEPTFERQVAAIARRFGPLTEAGNTVAGEPVRLWAELAAELEGIGAAWADSGAPAAPLVAAQARIAGRRTQERVLAEHQARAGGIEISGGGEWVLRCQDAHQWWRLAAVADVTPERSAMQRCRWCNGWFSLAGMRSDTTFCSPRHRSRFYQSPPASFWAEAL